MLLALLRPAGERAIRPHDLCGRVKQVQTSVLGTALSGCCDDIRGTVACCDGPEPTAALPSSATLFFAPLAPALLAKESFYFGSLEGVLAQRYPNQWPSEGILPSWRQTMETYYKNVLSVGRKLLGLIALALDLDEDFFEKVGALNDPTAVVRLLRYPGEVISSDVETYGASAHSDYGMVTLLLTDGVPGLQVCRDKSKQPHIWEDVPGIKGAFIVNIGDMMERWTNGLFRSTLHRVMPVGKERYSVVFFLDPNPDCNVKCLESCCSETCPPRFPPILAGDYIKERFRLTYATS